MKYCTTCNIEKSDNLFYRNNARKDGLTTSCMDCCKNKSKLYESTEEAKKRRRELQNTDEYKKKNSDRARRSYYKESNIKKRLNPEYREKNRINLFTSRQNLITVLGGKCKHCGFKDYRALQVDHINGGGTKELGKYSKKKYHKIVCDSFLRGENKYQLLCANCNWIKRHTNNEVPFS